MAAFCRYHQRLVRRSKNCDVVMKENADFPLTRISLIERVQDVDGSIRRGALEEFAESYRPALISFLVKCKNVNVGDAEDIVHDFMLNKILNGRVLELAGKKGRFRSLLRACLQNYLVDQIRKNKRDPALTTLESDDCKSDNSSPIDQVWAIALFREALMSMQAASEYWGIFKDRILTQPPIAYEQIIKTHGFDNPTKASNALVTAKRQFNRIIEDLIAKQSYLTDESTEEDLQIEIEYLRSQLADSNLVEMAIDSLASKQVTGASAETLSDTIAGGRLIFIDESADSNWQKSDTTALITHLLHQPVGKILDASDSKNTLMQSLLSNNLETLSALKKHFNNNAKTGDGSLPERINVTMTFACIAAYVVAGGAIEAITSTRREAMATRLSQLNDKEWIPLEIRRIFDEANELLS